MTGQYRIQLIGEGAPANVTSCAVGRYMFSPGAIASGSFGHVYAGYANDGCCVAVKRFLRPDREKFGLHATMMQKVGEHVSTSSMENLRCQPLTVHRRMLSVFSNSSRILIPQCPVSTPFISH